MKDIYVFNVTTGLTRPSAYNLTMLHGWCYPTDVFAKSKAYENMDDCVKDAVNFVNSQITADGNNEYAFIECNPLLTGVQDDDEEKKRWENGEMMKIHLLIEELNDGNHTYPLTCSILKVTTFSGFEVSGNQTLN